MERKKWTPKVDITDAHLVFREKRKWQLALRRYVLERNISVSYAFYFGLSIDEFRKWIEVQFTEGLSWDNFGTVWQFDHIAPVALFDFSIDADLVLCWNFINIRVKRVELAKNSANRMETGAIKFYFEKLYKKTGYSLCLKMIDKINGLETPGIVSEIEVESFVIKNIEHLEIISTLSKGEFNSLNMGISLDNVLLEREILKKFG